MEIWKDLKETNNLYQVSNLGRFKRKEKVSRFKLKFRHLNPQLHITPYRQKSWITA